MSRWSFTGADPRLFHAYGLLEPGASVEAPENPDPVWFTPEKPAKADTTSKKEQ